MYPSTMIDTEEQVFFPLVVFYHILAVALLFYVTNELISFPTGNVSLATGLGLYLLLLLRFPWIWLIVIPVLLPILDLTPITGCIYFSEFDFIILITVASGLIRKERWIKPLQLGTSGWIMLVLLITWQAYTTVRGILPLQPIEANSLTSYYSHYN